MTHGTYKSLSLMEKLDFILLNGSAERISVRRAAMFPRIRTENTLFLPLDLGVGGQASYSVRVSVKGDEKQITRVN